jgi:hypothetical protein
VAARRASDKERNPGCRKVVSHFVAWLSESITRTLFSLREF